MNNKDTKLIWEAVAGPVDVDLPPLPETPATPEGKNFHDKTMDRHANEQRNADLRDALSRLNDWVDDKIANINELTDDEIESTTAAVNGALEELEPVMAGAPIIDPAELEPQPEEDLYPGGEEAFGKDMADFSCPLPPGPDSF